MPEKPHAQGSLAGHSPQGCTVRHAEPLSTFRITNDKSKDLKIGAVNWWPVGLQDVVYLAYMAFNNQEILPVI